MIMFFSSVSSRSATGTINERQHARAPGPHRPQPRGTPGQPARAPRGRRGAVAPAWAAVRQRQTAVSDASTPQTGTRTVL